MKVLLISMGVIALLGFILFENSPTNTKAQISDSGESIEELEDRISELEECNQEMDSNLDEYANIVDQVQDITFDHDEDAEVMYSDLREIENIVDIGDPYALTVDCN